MNTSRPRRGGRLGAACGWDELDGHLSVGQWVVFGVPVSFDSSDPSRADRGPAEIREATPYLWAGGPTRLHDWALGRDRELPKAPLLDLGDVTYRPRFDTGATVEGRITTGVRRITELGGRALILGGEHWLTAPAVRGLLEVLDEVHVVHLDAHLDLDRRPFSPPDGGHLKNSNVMSHVCDLPGVASLTQLGVREFDLVVPTAADRRWQVVPSERVAGPPAGRFEHLPAGAPVYLSVDIDVLDPSVAPEVGWPVPGGLSWSTAAGVVRYVAETFELVGCDFVEVFGSAGRTNLAARCAGKLLMEVLLG